MGIRGTLAKEKFGFSMPVHAPLFPAPPYNYKAATLMILKYVTDGEKAAQILPETLSLPDKPTAALVFASYPESSLGPYDEVVLYLDVIYNDAHFQYGAYLYVTTDIAMAAGREMGGYPKKMAHIDFQTGPNFAGSMDRPAGVRVCSGSMKPAQKVSPLPPELTLNYLTTRIIPSPQRGALPTVGEIMASHWVVQPSEIWSGPGSLELTGASESDPLDQVPLVELLGCELIKGDIIVKPNVFAEVEEIFNASPVS